MKTFDPTRDIARNLSTIEESISFLGSVFTSSTSIDNIKRYNHWVSGSVSGSFYHGIFSNNFLNSLSTELMDISVGQSISSSFFTGPDSTNAVEKNRVYKLFAKALLGSEEERFVIDGEARDDLIFLAVRRSQFKDEIKKGTVYLKTIFSGSIDSSLVTSVESTRAFSDLNAPSSFQQTNRGDVADLTSGSFVSGRIFYQAGVLVLIPDRISNTGSDIGNNWSGSATYADVALSGAEPAATGKFDNFLDAVRYRFDTLSFVNRTNLHSTFYFCRALNDEFNYSSNPTFTDSSGRIVPTSGATNLQTRTYITKVGLLGENGEVLAVASLSQPVLKKPDIELTVRVRLDY